MSNRNAVIFDVDGVLVDSYRAHFESWKRVAAEHGREYTEAEFLAGFGRTSREILAESWSKDPLTEEQIRILDERKEGLYRSLIAENFPAIEGAAELIHNLHDAGFALAVGSSGPPANVQVVLDQLGIELLLGARITGADVTRGKPDPQVFELAAGRLQVQPRHCVVVEDAKAGIAAAHAAEMKCIGLVSTGHTREELAEADVVVHSLREVSVSMVESLLK